MRTLSFILILLTVSTAPASEFPVGARPGGMGDAYIASCNDALALYHSPGALMFLESMSLNFSFGWEGFPLMKNWAFFFAKPPQEGKQVGIGIVRTRRDYGETAYTSYQAIMPLTFSISRRMKTGLCVKYISQKRESGDFNAKASLDFGLMRRSGALSLAFVAKNLIKPKMRAFPANLSLGAALNLGFATLEGDVVANKWGDFTSDNRRYRLGAEFNPSRTFSLRCGWTDEYNDNGLSLGMGYHDRLKALKFDYCYRTEPDRISTGTHWISYTYSSIGL